MAKSEAQTEAAETGGGKKKGVLLLVVVAAVMLAVGGGAAWFFLGRTHPADASAARPVSKKPPVFFTLEPFVVNLAGEVQHYLQVGIDLKMADSEVSEKMKAHLPEIRNNVLLLLSSKQIDDLATLEGKNRLREEIRAAVNGPIGIQAAALLSEPSPGQGVGEAHAAQQEPATAAYAEPTEGVLEVLLTSFVIQ